MRLDTLCPASGFHGAHGIMTMPCSSRSCGLEKRALDMDMEMNDRNRPKADFYKF